MVALIFSVFLPMCLFLGPIAFTLIKTSILVVIVSVIALLVVQTFSAHPVQDEATHVEIESNGAEKDTASVDLACKEDNVPKSTGGDTRFETSSPFDERIKALRLENYRVRAQLEISLTAIGDEIEALELKHEQFKAYLFANRTKRARPKLPSRQPILLGPQHAPHPSEPDAVAHPVHEPGHPKLEKQHENDLLRHTIDSSLALINDNLREVSLFTQEHSTTGANSHETEPTASVPARTASTLELNGADSLSALSTPSPTTAQNHRQESQHTAAAPANPLLSTYQLPPSEPLAHQPSTAHHRHSASAPHPPRTDELDASPDDDDALQAAAIERIIKKRVFRKVELAFEICRRQGKFGGERRRLSFEESEWSDAGKVRIDSLTGMEEVMRGVTCR